MNFNGFGAYYGVLLSMRVNNCVSISIVWENDTKIWRCRLMRVFRLRAADVIIRLCLISRKSMFKLTTWSYIGWLSASFNNAVYYYNVFLV